MEENNQTKCVHLQAKQDKNTKNVTLYWTTSLKAIKRKSIAKLSSVMNSVQTVIDQELAQFGWVESIANNSISNFKSHKSNSLEQTTDHRDIFICHIIFYVIFFFSLFLYVFIDLGFGSFLSNKVTTLIKFTKRSKKPLLLKALTP
tara:strand:+ start:1092 stop:1529 length:438 start_codon:yes stop_codon:yes gene_type:complete